MNQKTEFLSRQHMDFKTLEGMKQILQSVTWRVKVEERSGKVAIYVRKKKIPEVRRLANEFGIANIKYDVKEISWFECWFKRFKIVDLKLRAFFDLASKDGDYSAECAFKKYPDGKIVVTAVKLIKPNKIPKYISKGQGKTPTGETFYFVEDPKKQLEVDKMVILNGKVFKVKEIVNKKNNPLTRIAVKHV